MTRAPESFVLEYPPAPPGSSAAHLREALAHSTDPSDVAADLEKGDAPFVVLDARSPEAWAAAHVPGAVNLPHRRIDAATTARLSKNVPIVTYCDGTHCNASTKAAAKLAELGFLVKEMIGGLDGWRRDGFEVEAGPAPSQAPASAGEAARKVACGC